jgi:hypothetical protein
MTSRLFVVSLGLWVGVACSSSSPNNVTGGKDAGGNGHDASTGSGGDTGSGSDAASDTRQPADAGPHDSGSTSTGEGGEAGGIPMSVCDDSKAAFTTSAAEGQWTDGDYFVRNNAWNTDAGPQTLYACSYSSWNVVAKEASTTDVKTYPDVQMDFQGSGKPTGSGVALNTFTSITSTFAEVSPHVGIYEDAYDIFVNSKTLVGPGTTEIMIWVDNFNQVPAGSKFASAVSLDGRAWDVYYEADNGNGGHYIAFVADTNFSFGTLNLVSFFNYVIGQSWIPDTAPLNQICFGVEICETNDANATFEFTNFSIDAH